VLASPLRTSRPAPAVGPAPAMGADTRELLASLGIGEQEQGRLRALGVL